MNFYQHISRKALRTTLCPTPTLPLALASPPHPFHPRPPPAAPAPAPAPAGSAAAAAAPTHPLLFRLHSAPCKIFAVAKISTKSQRSSRCCQELTPSVYAARASADVFRGDYEQVLDRQTPHFCGFVSVLLVLQGSCTTLSNALEFVGALSLEHAALRELMPKVHAMCSNLKCLV